MAYTYTARYMNKNKTGVQTKGGFKTVGEAWEYVNSHACQACKKQHESPSASTCATNWIVVRTYEESV